MRRLSLARAVISPRCRASSGRGRAIFAGAASRDVAVAMEAISAMPRQLGSKHKYVLAREAISSKLSCIWVDEPPSFILESLINDVTMFANQ